MLFPFGKVSKSTLELVPLRLDNRYSCIDVRKEKKRKEKTKGEGKILKKYARKSEEEIENG